MADSIGGTLLSTYGLILANLSGNVDLPKYKKIIDKNDLDVSLRLLDEKKVKITMFGFYTTKAAMVTSINNFRDKIKAAVKQQWVFSSHGFNELCFIKEEVKIDIYDLKNVEINLTLTITQ